MALVLRTVKGAELTWSELDNNFVWLQNRIEEVEQQISGNEVVRVTLQTFLPSEQQQARSNILAADIESVNDLVNRVSDIELWDPVMYTAQQPTVQQQQQARENIGVWLTSLYDESFDFDKSTNPGQQFTLAFSPTQVEMVFDTNTPIWFDQGDFTVVGNVLTINYPMEDEAIIKIKYWHYV